MGRSRLAAHVALTSEISHVAPDFAWLDLDDASLATDCEVDDLDQIDRGGALREAANELLAEAGDESRAAGDRSVASAALARLYGYAQAVSQ